MKKKTILRYVALHTEKKDCCFQLDVVENDSIKSLTMISRQAHRMVAS